MLRVNRHRALQFGEGVPGAWRCIAFGVDRISQCDILLPMNRCLLGVGVKHEARRGFDHGDTEIPWLCSFEDAAGETPAQLSGDHGDRITPVPQAGTPAPPENGTKGCAKTRFLPNKANFPECCTVWIGLIERMLAAKVRHFVTWLCFAELASFCGVQAVRVRFRPQFMGSFGFVCGIGPMPMPGYWYMAETGVSYSLRTNVTTG